MTLGSFYMLRKVIMPKVSGARDKIETLKRELNLVINENNIYRCEGGLKLSPLPFKVKSRFELIQATT